MPVNEAKLTDKINQLADELGEWVRDLIATEQIPKAQIENFYGRHSDWREAILAAMKAGASYSQAYNRSDGVFDTKNWEKIPKPPAFVHRDEECATSLVWKLARRLRRPVKHLSRLVEVAHDGDAATRRQKSSLYAKSRQNSLHALIAHARQLAQDDRMLYQGMALCLDALTTPE